MLSKDDAVLCTLLDDKEFVVKMLSQETPEDVQKLFQENGVEVSMEEVNALGAELNRISTTGDELTEESLESVTGGIAAATVWAVAKCVIAVGGAALAIYKWYKSR